ncbi:unnamed protein product [Paramecium primaurelia]|uniref:Uncharacterized protein n=1 Tax=Paramecium primaurelia TaxID=5886 RepID=A0A8S1LE62_PARPR|nr:unnamed protein product [Paramecium primaurelia]
MQINKEQSKDKIIQDSKNENSHPLINIICDNLKNICTLTLQIKAKQIKKKSLNLKKKKNSKTKISKRDKKTNQCYCQTCPDFKLLEYLSQLSAVENLQHQLDKVKELIYLFE